MSEKQTTRDAGLAHVFSILLRKDWKYNLVKQGRVELYRVKRKDTEKIIQIRTLSKKAPVPFPQGLDILDSIDYLIICNNLQEQPNLIVLEPKTIRRIIHKDSFNESAYWLQTADYDKHGVAFEQIFG